MRIPADSILIQGCSVSVDESDLTGESLEQQRKAITDQNHQLGTSAVLLARSNIKTGEGLAVVVAVGENTYAGDLGTAISDEDETTPL